jgi:membrane fusion protein, heavy metal efflux system
VLVDLPERYLARVSEGLNVSVAVDAYPGETFRATVTRIGQVMDPATRRLQVRCDLPNPEGVLKPEMFARVSLLTRDGQQALRLPNTALVTEGLYSFVFVETAPGAFIKRKVELSVQDREYSYLSGGVTRGERIVSGGALLLQSELASGS